MKMPVRRRPSAATIIATLALVVALGGTGYAAASLPRNSVGTKQLKNNAVTSKKVKDGALLRQDFKAGQLPASTDAYAGFLDGPIAAPASLATVGTLVIPKPGSYVIFAKLWLFDNVNTGVLVDCTLSAGGDSDDTRTTLEGNSGTVVNGAAISLNVVHTFAAAGSAALKCNAFGVNVSINDIKMTAIRVDSLSNTGL
jgi:hypothetical protein